MDEEKTVIPDAVELPVMPEINLDTGEIKVTEETSAEGSKPATPPSQRAIISIRKIDPNVNLDDVAQEDIEGIQFILDEDGNMAPEMAEAIILEMYVSRVPDKRTVCLTTRLRNDFVITETSTALTEDQYNEEQQVEECKARTILKIFDYLKFVWCCGTVSANKIKSSSLNGTEVPVTEG